MEGFDTPEEAVFDASIPPRSQRVLDRAIVYTLTNDHPERMKGLEPSTFCMARTVRE